MVLHFVTGGKTGKCTYIFLTLQIYTSCCVYLSVLKKCELNVPQDLQNLVQVIYLFADWIEIISIRFSYFKTSHAFVPGFLLHPTFSEQPPTNGVKTWLVKMC